MPQIHFTFSTSRRSGSGQHRSKPRLVAARLHFQRDVRTPHHIHSSKAEVHSPRNAKLQISLFYIPNVGLFDVGWGKVSIILVHET